MSHFFKHVLVRFFSHKNGNDTELSEISNDELVTAYEYVVWAHGVEFPLMALAPWHADEVHGPCEVTATLRKLARDA